MCIDERVSLSGYDPKWIELAEREIERLAIGLGVPKDIEHIGSTAVPDLVAKPIIDLMLGVPTYPPADSLRGTIQALGYEDCGEAGVPGRLYFRRRSLEAYNLHLLLRGGALWASNLAFRDLLRSNAAARFRYAQAKEEALRIGATTLVEYSASKSKTMSDLVALAKASAT